MMTVPTLIGLRNHKGETQVKKLLLASVVFAMAAVPALADVITLTATVDGSPAGSASSNTGQLDVTGVALGAFTLNTITANSQAVLPAPGLLFTNSLNLQQQDLGNHTLQLDIVATGLTGTAGLNNFLSTFSVSGLTTGWTARETTTINGFTLADTGIFTTPSGSAFSTDSALTGSTFSADVHYFITSNGIGGFNGGINVSAVPGPVVGAGLPGLLVAGFGLWGWRRREQQLGAAV